MSQYGTLITNVGLAKIANAQVTQSTVGLAYIALGDGNGAHYVSTQNQTTLVNEVWRGPIANLSIDPNNSNRVIADAVIPTSTGGYTIREIGLFDEDNNLIAVGQYPETYKPQLNEGISGELLIHFTIETANADVVTLAIDPTVIIASRTYVDEKVGEAVSSLISKNTMGQPNGVATLGPDGKVPAEQLDIDTSDLATKQEVEDVQQELTAHKADKVNPHSVTKGQVGLGNVDNVKQMPIAGGAFTGVATAYSNTSYTVRQLRNVILSPSDANVNAMQNGDIWIKYK